jgi:hypothetical protein
MAKLEKSRETPQPGGPYKKIHILSLRGVVVFGMNDCW